MKIAIITDLHFGARNDSDNFRKYFAKFYNDVFFPYLDKHNISTCVCLGDTLDRRKYVNYVTLDFFIKTLINPLNERNIDTHFIIGNHDTTWKNTNSLNSPSCLIYPRNNIHIYSSPEEVIFGKLPILILPWITEENKDDAFNLIKNTKADVVFGHLEICGFSMYKGMQGHIGIDASLFGNFDKVLSGHFHHKSDNGKIFYLGTPYEITWNDYNDTRGFHVFDTETRKLEFIKNPNTMFEKVIYDEVNIPNKKIISNLKEKYVRVVITNKKSVKKYEKFMDLVYEAGPYDVDVFEDFSKIFSHDHDIDTDDYINSEENALDILNSYIETLDVVSFGEQGTLKQIIQKIYVEAINL